MRTYLNIRLVRGPDLQPRAISAVSCRPRGLTRRSGGVSNQALRRVLGAVVLAGCTLGAHTGLAQSCANIQGEYAFTETASMTVILPDGGGSETTASKLTGQLQVTQSGCSITVTPFNVTITPANSGSYRTRHGTVSGNAINLSDGTIYFPLPPQIGGDLISWSSSASGVTSGNRIQVSGSGTAEAYTVFGRTGFTWTSVSTWDKILDCPIINVQPTNQTVYAGATVSFAVLATHRESLSYQWRRNSINVSGATGSVMTLQNVAASVAGDYTVLVSNSSCTVTSQVARLVVNALPPPGVPWHESWEVSSLGTFVPPSNIAADKGTWHLDDTASEPDCAPTQNRASIEISGGRKLLRITTAPHLVCAENAWVSMSEESQPGFSLPLLPATEVSFFEQGALSNATWSGSFPCLLPPCGDTTNLRFEDDRNNVVVYVIQRAANYVPHAMTNGPSAIGYLEIFLDPGGGTFVRDLYADFAAIAGVGGVGSKIRMAVFEVDAVGWGVLDDLKIGRGFIEHQPPSIGITWPVANSIVSNPGIMVQGTAQDNDQVNRVLYQLNGGVWQPANGTTNWSASVTLTLGTNTLRAYAVDLSGNTSPTNSVTVVCLCSYVFSPPYWDLLAAGGSTNVAITAGGGCAWSVINPCPGWLTVTPTNGGGTGTFTVTAATNSTGALRSCTLLIAGEPFYVAQAAPGAVVMTFVLRPGYNLLAVPFAGTGLTNAESLAQAIPNCTGVWRWDATSQSWSGHPKGGPNNFALSPGGVCLVSVTGSGASSEAGNWGVFTQALKRGYNLVSLPQARAASVTNAESLAVSVPNCSGVWKWEPATQTWSGHPKGGPNNFLVEVGRPYLVSITADGTW